MPCLRWWQISWASKSSTELAFESLDESSDRSQEKPAGCLQKGTWALWHLHWEHREATQRRGPVMSMAADNMLLSAHYLNFSRVGKLKEISIFKTTQVTRKQNIFSKEEFFSPFSGYVLFCRIRTFVEDLMFPLRVLSSSVFYKSKLPHSSDIWEVNHFYS